MNRFPVKTISVYAVAALFLILNGCAAPKPFCRKDDVPYCLSKGVFTHEWYDYYERALSCMEGGCYEHALGDLDRAIQARPDDRRMAKTYGMHLMDYFPHREKGLIFYLTENYDAALKEFESSLEYEKSDKALFYRDKARKYLLERDERVLSTPQISISSLSASGEITTRDDPINLSGTAEDRQYVADIRLNGLPVFMEAAERRFDFEEKIKLDEGIHEVNITAMNLLGGSSSRSIKIRVDRSGPIIALTQWDGKELQGRLYDATGDMSLTFNNNRLKIPPGKQADFSVPVSPGASHNIILGARDRLGNRTQAVFDPDIIRQTDSPLTACNSDNACKDATPLFALNNSPPEILLDNPVSPVETFSEIFSLKGRITGSRIVESVSVNDIPVQIIQGIMIFFSHPLRLKNSENRITIRATDIYGIKAEKNLVIIRKTPEPLKLKYRCVMKAIPFENRPEPEDNGQATAFEGLFLKQMVAQKRFRMKLQESLSELIINQDGYKKAPSDDKDIGIDPEEYFLLSGYIFRTKEGDEIVSRVIEVQSGKILEILDVYGESGGMSSPENMADELAGKYLQAFPLVRTRILRREPRRYLIHTDKDIRICWPLVFGSDAECKGETRIDEICRQGNYWIKLSGGMLHQPEIGDWVITK